MTRSDLAIDLHNHVILLDASEKLKDKYPKLVARIEPEPNGLYTVATGDRKVLHCTRRGRYDFNERLRDMNKMRVEMHALTVGVNMFHYSSDPQVGLDFSRAQNDAMADVVSRNPDKFIGIGVVPLQDPILAAEEMERAVRTLGLKGIQIAPSVNGKNLDDPNLEPFYTKAEQLNTLISVHPDADVKHPLMGLVGERLEKYSLGNFIGNPLDTTIAIASIIFGGVLERHPKLKFLFLHGGGFAPYQRGRWEHGYKVRPEARVNISYPPSKYISLLTFDTVCHFEPALRFLISTVGTDRVVLGSDYAADMSDTDPVGTVKNLKLPKEDEERILSGNARRLLGI